MCRCSPAGISPSGVQQRQVGRQSRPIGQRAHCARPPPPRTTAAAACRVTMVEREGGLPEATSRSVATSMDSPALKARCSQLTVISGPWRRSRALASHDGPALVGQLKAPHRRAMARAGSAGYGLVSSSKDGAHRRRRSRAAAIACQPGCGPPARPVRDGNAEHELEHCAVARSTLPWMRTIGETARLVDLKSV